MKTESNIKRPVLVTIAALILAIFAFIQIFGVFLILGLNPYTGLLAVVLSINLVIAYGLFTLKKWAYWVYLVMNVVAAISFMVALDITTLQTNLMKIIPILISIAWIGYFLTRPVRTAFRIEW